ncbi:MAG: hypothetical protein V1776_05150 [Candidatus Diapherotrites archaeon]
MTQIEMRPILKDTYHIVIAIVMVLLILGLATWSGIIQCRDIPGWCDVYYTIKGPPKTLIVFGNEGLGDPDLLASALREPNHAAATNISRQDIDFVSAGNLKQFDLVIVTRARQISTSKLEAFMEYVDAGGRLVWTGDAGTVLGEKDEFLYLDDIDTNNSFLNNKIIEKPENMPQHELISPWARKITSEKRIIRFDHYLSVQYEGNWCQIRDCEISQQVGTLVPESGADHKLIYGIKQNLQLYGDFALTQDIGIGSTRVLSVDTESNVIGLDKKELGRIFPIIVTSGIGERITYYAVPPEYFIQEPMQYWLFIENLYDGMLR